MKYEYIKRIEEKTKKLNITVKKMLLDLGYSDSLISQWKRGSEPSMIKLLKIAEYLKMDIVNPKKQKKTAQKLGRSFYQTKTQTQQISIS